MLGDKQFRRTPERVETPLDARPLDATPARARWRAGTAARAWPTPKIGEERPATGFLIDAAGAVREVEEVGGLWRMRGEVDGGAPDFDELTAAAEVLIERIEAERRHAVNGAPGALSDAAQIAAETEAAAQAALEMAAAERAVRRRAAEDAKAQIDAESIAAELAVVEMMAAERAARRAAAGEVVDVVGYDAAVDLAPADVALFVFDMRGGAQGYAAAVFNAVAHYLENGNGLCVFCDGVLAEDIGGDAQAPEALRRLRGYARRIETADPASPLADLGAANQGFRGYVAAMWTDAPENIPALHLKLSQRAAPGYLGCLLLDNARFREMVEVESAALALTERYYFEDGEPSVVAG